MIQGLEFLEKDKQTEVIVLISKPPAQRTMEKVLEVARMSIKPVVVNFLGAEVSPAPQASLTLRILLRMRRELRANLLGESLELLPIQFLRK